MTPELSFTQYGKTDVRLTQVLRHGKRHELTELSVDILFRGDFDASYTSADNSIVLPTDTMKNTVYVVARQHPIESPEGFARELAAHFLARIERLRELQITIGQAPWERISNHNAAFVRSGLERRMTTLTASRVRQTFTSGVHGLEILKTADSAFAGFLKDEWTTLPEARDRLLGTVLDADWTYNTTDLDFDAEWKRVRSALLHTFAAHVSESVQHTLYDMASAALKASHAVSEIHLIMPNKHRILFDLSKFGLDNPNQIFVPVDQPSGFIEARLSAK